MKWTFSLSVFSLTMFFLEPLFASRDFHNKVIYGEDNRKDVYEISESSLLDAADATVALIPTNKLKLQSDGSYAYDFVSFKKNKILCDGEPFEKQPVLADCSGALVKEDIISTAGHCISASSCKDSYIVFNYKMKSGEDYPQSFPAEDVYTCKEVLYHSLTKNVDVAVVRLDRPVPRVKPVVIAKNPPTLTDELYVVGHPSGLPSKITTKGAVRSLKNGFFVTNLDTYGGNSGSPVFLSTTNEMVGVLVRGESDFSFKNGACFVSRKCETHECRGEDVTYGEYVQRVLSSH